MLKKRRQVETAKMKVELKKRAFGLKKDISVDGGRVSWLYVSVYTDDIWLKPRSKPPTWKKTLSSVPGENWQPDPMMSGTKLKPVEEVLVEQLM